MLTALPTVGLTGYTRLSKGLAGVLFIGYAASLLFPWIIEYVALIPANRTIPFVWNVITAGYIELSIFGLIVNILGLLFSAKLLEPIWTSREFLKFIIFVNSFTLVGVYITAITCYYITRREKFLYTRLSGFHGVLSGFMVGAKQTTPDQEILALGGFNMRAEWLPSLLVFMSVIISFVTPEALSYLPFVIFGTYGGWLYLRYLLRNTETDLNGDPKDEFSFSTFFPGFIRPAVDFIASIFHKLLCGKRSIPWRVDGDHVSDSISMLGFDTTESSRRDIP
ncbi:hypothetical protein AAC387_Pa03g2580 [Persea americana]